MPNMSATAAAAGTLSLTPAVAHTDPLTENPPSPNLTSNSFALAEGEKRYIVRYGDSVNADAESQALEQKGIEVKETLSHTMKASVVVATLEEIESLQKSDDVASVELDTPVSIFGATSIWGLDRVDQRSGRDGQYAIGDEGAGVNVYVVDSGLHLSHSEFSGRVTASWWGIHDGRGVSDCSGHGTHVAGTAAGTTYGVAKKANIIPVRVLECDGSGWSSTVMAGMDWAVAHHVAGQPAVMNLSIGGFTNASFDQAVQSAVNDGITVVAAAGNQGVDSCWASPARVPAAITVAATNINDAQALWSNYGSCVDIQAPGVGVRSAWNDSPTGYKTLDGSSMAAPHVSGAAAILLSRDSSLSPAQVHQSMIYNATAGVVSANKGATPNRLLFIPGPAPAHPSCSNLKLGDAWSGVGTHCGLQGTAAVLSATEATVNAIEAPAPAVTAIEAADPTPTTDATEVPLPAPGVKEAAPAPAPGEPAPPQTYVPAQERVEVPNQFVPVAGNAAKEVAVAVAEPEVISPEAPSAAIVNPPPAASPNGDATLAPVVDTFEAAAEPKVPLGANNSIWVIIFGLVFGGVAITYAIRRRNSSKEPGKKALPSV